MPTLKRLKRCAARCTYCKSGKACRDGLIYYAYTKYKNNESHLNMDAEKLMDICCDWIDGKTKTLGRLPSIEEINGSKRNMDVNS